MLPFAYIRSVGEHQIATDKMASGMTAKQEEELWETFQMFDKDNDDKISLSELRDLMEKLGQTPSEDELNDIMHTADIDKDGYIDFQEFSLIMLNHGSDPTEQLMEAFQIIDTDNSGTISACELKAVLKNICEDIVSDEVVADIIRDIDLDGDGLIDYEEFVKVFSSSNMTQH